MQNLNLLNTPLFFLKEILMFGSSRNFNHYGTSFKHQKIQKIKSKSSSKILRISVLFDIFVICHSFYKHFYKHIFIHDIIELTFFFLIPILLAPSLRHEFNITPWKSRCCPRIYKNFVFICIRFVQFINKFLNFLMKPIDFYLKHYSLKFFINGSIKLNYFLNQTMKFALVLGKDVTPREISISI